jgi:hypothetical protein
VTTVTEPQGDELQRRWHFIKQCEELQQLAESAEWALRQEQPEEASGDIAELKGRIESVYEDFDPSDFSTGTDDS